MIQITDQRIVVEDDYFLAIKLMYNGQSMGARMLKFLFNHREYPARNITAPVMLDVNPEKSNSLDLARMLRERGASFLFFTGYDANAVLSEFRNVDRVGKPIDATHLKQPFERCCRTPHWFP